jgi:hypothetical protein
MAGEIFCGVMELVQPVIEEQLTAHETIHLLRNAGDQHLATLPIIIGGNQLNEQVC